MAEKLNKVKPIPDGYNTVTPWIITRDTEELIDFIKEAFNGHGDFLVHNEDGTIGHAEIRIGGSVVMMFDAGKEWPETPGFLRLYVEDGDAVYEQALKAGAAPITEMTNLFWGDRVGRVRDPLGNIWWIQTRVEDLDQEEAEKRSKQKEYIEAMKYVQNSLTTALKMK
ncbi:putative glyoxalase superfamily protein PhnB [Scopulibacillus darangshiensis]|uniref:Putative glyoxalase superfamily protein PhnB n=1 Tax=Scopulibacillus darangshiensis TaxID=442528 RepID=A0A4R2NUK2_9BACL|nr:VOC family protein [Scopulibacillus darangshiensis]TCP25597.1 putative glyoxalase superfamily protein PhnB [Scopulibacillus darangshiensis]